MPNIDKLNSYHCAIYYTIIHEFNIFWGIAHYVDLTSRCGSVNYFRPQILRLVSAF